ncbi:gamma-glutamyltransferase [Sorangium sp. So ce426]|uniref:gamma-glutamyltransferase n=1 Tax=Sorangium sp. So ce426 TaxID=3133312 RepID=UPI003F5BB2AA
MTDPFSCGIGGGGFMLVYLAGEQEVIALDHRETAPSRLEARSFYEDGAPIAFNELVTSGLSVGVPGTVRGWSEALRRHGTLGLGDVLKRAIQVAEAGFDVDQTFLDQTRRNLARFQAITSSKALFLGPDGAPWPVGTIFKNPDLAGTYRPIAEGGEKAFYEGRVAEAIVAAVKSPPVEPGSALDVRAGVIELSDLLGSPGGSTIITTVLQILVGHIELGLPIDSALAAPRLSQRNSGDGATDAETAFLSAPEAEGLASLGHVLSDAGTMAGEIGAATALRFNGDGTVTAVAEPVRRHGGSAMVEQER